MKYIPKWLSERLPQAKETVEDDLPSNSESEEDDMTVPDLQTLDPDSSDTDESTGSETSKVLDAPDI